MGRIAQEAKWRQGFLKRIEKARAKGDRHAVSRISSYYRVPVKTAYDWQAKWDGAWKSLIDRSHRPHHHPKAHTDAEIALMVQITREYGFLPPLLMYQELMDRGYRRSYGGLKRFLRKHFAPPSAPRVHPEKPKAYDGGAFPGERVQIDVKYVPRACLYGEKLYQYTLVDEFSRWCYREIYAQHSDYAASQFLLHAAKVAPFQIREVQTDNGHEFTNALFGQKKLEASRFELALCDLGIAYRRIRVGTPRHNGRVERQHGLDTKRFYRNLHFLSLADARSKLDDYNAWSNSRIKVCLNFHSPDQIVAGLCG